MAIDAPVHKNVGVRSLPAGVRAVIVALFLIISSEVRAIDFNAYHFAVRDDFHGIGDFETSSGVTIYRPDLALTLAGTLGNQLRGKSINEIYLKIVFKSGVTPSIAKL